MIIDIKNVYGDSLFVTEAESMREAVEKAIVSGANLRGANLECANLEGANLEGANLEGADLRSANLEGADLEGANLRSANLECANLEGANLRSANLRSANLECANLRGANLECANLEGANLEGANLENSNGIGDWLGKIRNDMFLILDATPNEVAGLAAALTEGRVDGSTYEGPCACLIGTLANVRGCKFDQLGVSPTSSRPAEQWFLKIKTGYTPLNSSHCAIALSWVREWQAAHPSTT